MTLEKPKPAPVRKVVVTFRSVDGTERSKSKVIYETTPSEAYEAWERTVSREAKRESRKS